MCFVGLGSVLRSIYEDHYKSEDQATKSVPLFFLNLFQFVYVLLSLEECESYDSNVSNQPIEPTIKTIFT